MLIKGNRVSAKLIKAFELGKFNYKARCSSSGSLWLRLTLIHSLCKPCQLQYGYNTCDIVIYNNKNC